MFMGTTILTTWLSQAVGGAKLNSKTHFEQSFCSFLLPFSLRSTSNLAKKAQITQKITLVFNILG
jgi:hypothetical protein